MSWSSATGLTVWADKVVVDYGEGGADRHRELHATGNVRIKTDGPDRHRRRGDLRSRRRRSCTLTGNVTVVNAQGTLNGPELTVNLATNTSTFYGGNAAAASPASSPRNERGRASAKRRVDQTGWLVAHGLAKSFGKRAVVRDVSIAVRRGEAVGLLGPNGAGKTTVFTMIMGLVKPDKGKILLDGRADHPPAAVPARPARHRLPAAGALDLSRPQRRAATSWPCSRATCSAQGDAQGAARDAARRVRHRPSAPSPTPWRCRAASAGASRSPGPLAADPVFMLLDEPFAGVDPIAVAEVKGLVRQLTQRGIGVLITDHSVRETLRLVDRAYLIHGGKVMIQGKPETISADPEARRVYLGESFEV